ncbi:MAG: hypothetical protein LBH31_03845 [Burkholderiaceae bacterium]|jgi:hypothetical protein|nr:hypothetical protein [Burkholderiaceae bacterium]
MIIRACAANLLLLAIANLAGALTWIGLAQSMSSNKPNDGSGYLIY